MKLGRPALLIATLVLAACSNEPVGDVALTGDPTAVLGFPHVKASDRFLIENCCTLKLAPEVRAKAVQGIDSAGYEVIGSGFKLAIVFGPYDGGMPLAGYNLIATQTIDGVKLETFIWEGQVQPPPEGRLLWIARVGGGTINGMKHTPWTLRMSGTCGTKAGCDALPNLVNSLRF
jgi:hypothetical protein